MLSYFAGKYLISLSYKGVQVFGRVFATERLARAWEQDAYDAIDSGRPLPDEREANPSEGSGLEQPTAGA